MIDRSLDGVVLIAPVSSRARLRAVADTVPTVVIGRHGPALGYDTVTDDDFAGAGLVVAHLAALGHRRIAHIEHRETDQARLAEMPNAGLSVPGDISVAGYDNISPARIGPVPLTTVDQAGHQVGVTAARLLLERIADRGRPAAQVRFSPTLVVRASTAPPPVR